MIDFYSLFYQLEYSGFYEYVLPFLLVFVIIFAILEKTYLFGKTSDSKPRTNINVVLGLILGLMIVVNTDITFFMREYLSRMSSFIVIAVMFMLVLALFAKPEGDDDRFLGLSMGWAAGIAICGVLYSLLSAEYDTFGFANWLVFLDSSIISFVIGILLIPCF